MNIAITGHTSGIGLAFSQLLLSTGYSRNNGWDISQTDNLIQELNDKDYDVFINNAYNETYQSKLLEKLFNVWKDKPKIIINIGSYVVDYPRIETNHNNNTWHYRDHKQDLAQLFRRLAKQQSVCRLGLINPGPTDTPMIAHLKTQKIQPVVVATTIKLMIENWYMKEVTVYD